MRLLVLTIAIGDLYTQIGQITHPFMMAYAKRIGSDFHVMDSATAWAITPHWEKFRIYDLLDVYDRILYVDTDALIKKDCPDLFESVPDDMIGAFNEGAHFERKCPNYYNTGVMVISKRHKDVFTRPQHATGDINTFFEQDTLNGLFISHACKMFPLPKEFNLMNGMEEQGYIVHKAGSANALNELKELARVMG